MTWIEPLQLETWIVNVFAGSIDIFVIMSMIVIASFAAYLRITYLVAMMLVFIFIAMFASNVSSPFIIAMAVTGLFMFIFHFIKVFISNR